MGFHKHRRPVLAPNDNIPGQLSNNDYSTDELDTGGKWIDGKTIYRQVFDMGTLPDGAAVPGAQASVAHGITGLDTVVRLIGLAVSGTPTYRVLPYSDSTAANALALEANATVVAVTAWANWTDHTATTIMEYTKS